MSSVAYLYPVPGIPIQIIVFFLLLIGTHNWLAASVFSLLPDTHLEDKVS